MTITGLPTSLHVSILFMNTSVNGNFIRKADDSDFILECEIHTPHTSALIRLRICLFILLKWLIKQLKFTGSRF